MTKYIPDNSPTEPMFSAIAARYDRCNHGFSLGVDRLWRRRLAKRLDIATEATALDVACGTGDTAFALLKHTPTQKVVALDCSEAMIQLALEKRMLKYPCRWMADKDIRCCVADAASLPFEEASFDVVTCVFGLRNMPDHATALRQMYRVLTPGGRLGIGEFSLPTYPPLRRLYTFYLSRVMPLLGRWVVGDAAPLRYLSDSIHRWDASVRLEDDLAAAGFTAVCSSPLTGGIVTLTLAQKPVA